MVRGSTTKKHDANGEPNPEVTERKRLKKLAFSNKILSETPAKASVHLNPSKTVIKHHGKDILKKSQRKNRFLFAFPGLIAPIGGGKIGELKDLGTKNPILYLDFPQGQMKLFGTIVYPKNRYLTLQFSRGGKNVMCEDYFDNMIVFSDAWWIGMKDENPEEDKLDFPKELNVEQEVEYDVKGGAGAASVDKQGVPKTRIKCGGEQSPETPLEDDLSDGENNLNDIIEVSSVRQSERTAGKIYNFAESYPTDSSAESSPEASECDKKEVEVDTSTNDATASKEVSRSNNNSLVQATISTLFKKVEEKKASTNPKKSPASKVSSKKWQHAGSKRKINQDEGSKKKAKNIKGKDAGENIMEKRKECEVEDDDIEEFSSASQDIDDSDEDWAA
ncbi:DNA-binding protein RHL1 [Quillaja saponaria]|uniref:DNA-binding protein RHL1 n=1 Tax=Quillaja saponaria TaxID=32244 RepID=A0AAD7VGW8_QUISA|nr:DNA-binding protein RHL1 [Quillaja saponaria]